MRSGRKTVLYDEPPSGFTQDHGMDDRRQRTENRGQMTNSDF